MGVEAVNPPAAPAGAVFLSYASQDAEAAGRICAALRAAGIEVWFDKSELRGGDAWDQKIRRELHDCALFMPVISANTAARHEGYFRLEWDLADQRTHMIAHNRAFIVPVSVDATSENSADIPDSFRRVQWTRLPGGEPPPAFVERVLRLLSGQVSIALRASTPAIERTPASSGSKRFMPAAVAGTIAAALLVVVAFFALEKLRGPRPAVQGESIAVLPLTNESGDASQQYFSDGISEDLITALSQFSGLKVIGRSSSFQFRDTKEDSKTIGAKLGVAHLIEGSVRRAGGVVRISAELIDAADGSTQWSERYDRPYKDLFALQDEVTRAVAGALKTRLLAADRSSAQLDRPPSGNLDAYNALLQGRFYEARDTEIEARKAIEQYSAATRLDPRYALAWSLLSRAWVDLGGYYLGGTPMLDAYAKGRAASATALVLAPDLAFSHVAHAFVLQYADFDWRAAERELHRALELTPNDGEAKFQLGNLLAAQGKPEQAVALTREALARDRLHAHWYRWLALYLSGMTRLDEAEQAIRQAIELQPSSESYRWILALIEIQRGDAEAALATAQQEIAGLYRDTAVTMARQIGTDRVAADADLGKLIDKYGNYAAYQIAQTYALRRDPDKTFAWLDRAWSNRDGGVVFLLNDPFILRYKDDPRFAAFCRKVGLPTPAEVARGT